MLSLSKIKLTTWQIYWWLKWSCLNNLLNVKYKMLLITGECVMVLIKSTKGSTVKF